MKRLTLVAPIALLLAACAGHDHAPVSPSPEASSDEASSDEAAGDGAQQVLSELQQRLVSADTGAYRVHAGFGRNESIDTVGTYRISDESSASSVTLHIGTGRFDIDFQSDQEHTWMRLTSGPGQRAWPCWLQADGSTLVTLANKFPGPHVGLPPAVTAIIDAEATRQNADESIEAEAPLYALFDLTAAPLREAVGIHRGDDHTLGFTLDPTPEGDAVASLGLDVINLLFYAEKDGYTVAAELDEWVPKKGEDNRVTVDISDLGREVALDPPDEVRVVMGAGLPAIQQALGSCTDAASA